MIVFLRGRQVRRFLLKLPVITEGIAVQVPVQLQIALELLCKLIDLGLLEFGHVALKFHRVLALLAKQLTNELRCVVLLRMLVKLEPLVWRVWPRRRLLLLLQRRTRRLLLLLLLHLTEGVTREGGKCARDLRQIAG